MYVVETVTQKLAAAVSVIENNLMVLVFCGQLFQLTNTEPAFDTCYSDCEKRIMQGGSVLGVIKVLMHWMLGILKLNSHISNMWEILH